ncbi:hypothetical protein MMC13_005932 [Lambiella insularis]|nr:hypothetical protein [Lambiella insularis]
MPARLSSMELSDPVTPATWDAPNRRKSGRTVQKPVSVYQPDSNVSINSSGSGKRKRAEAVDIDTDADPLGVETSSDENESEPDEEELKEQRQRASKGKRVQSKPAAKKPKIAAAGTMSLAMRPAINGAKKISKPRKPRAKKSTSDNGETGIYAEIFVQGHTTDAIATEWIKRYDDHNAEAMCELVNFVLKCTGCDLQVDVHDIEDPDNVTSKISDLQDEYQAQKITDYPLISKARGATFSRYAMTNLFHSIIAAAHASGILYSDVALVENIEIWVTTMSSSGIRPFRHTATVVSLAVASAMCDIMKEIVENIAMTMLQKESERKKKSVNKARVASLQTMVEENKKNKDLLEGWLKDIFDTVFIHRYRDVDPKIRVDCSSALGSWITTCPDIFFEGQYLRYLGWVLSDSSAPTRAEVVKQLAKLYKNKENVGRLRAFTERFRPRMVEMATQDAEPAIRASVVELLDMIREIGLLEPDDIDTIGKLIFDSEPRVRKAVAGFFAENIADLFESTVEELGGEEALEEALGDSAEDDYDNPRRSWLKLKCLAEVLQSYDTSGEESPTESSPFVDSVGSTILESRYSMAAQSICEGVPEVKDWEMVAGYLLYDHSSTLPSHDTDDPQTAFKIRCQLSEKEERLLLEILNAGVKSRLATAMQAETDKKGKRTKARKDESREIQESTATHLAHLIPRLLRKFGASPYTASAVLRLEHILDLEIFQDLRQDSQEYASLLDDISKQFLTHADGNVLAEAKTALLHARGYEDLEEVTEGKVQELWEGTIWTLRQLAQAKNPSIANLASTLQRISSLSSISDCTEIFEVEARSGTKSGSQAGSLRVIDILLELIRTYGGDEDADSSVVVSGAIRSLLFYYMWVVRSLKAKIEQNEQLDDGPDYGDVSSAIQEVVSSKHKLDDSRLAAMGCLLDLHTMFATLRHLKRSQMEKDGNADANAVVASLVREVPKKAQGLVLESFLAAEKAYAQKAKRTLEPPANDDPPDDPESEPEDLSESEDDGDDDDKARRSQHRQHELLLAEKRLCEFTGKIVLALVAQVLDSSGPTKGALRKRILRNKTKLGANFKEVLAFLDDAKAKRSHKAKAKPATKPVVKEKAGQKSKARITEADDEEDEDDAIEDVDGQGEEADLARQAAEEDREDDGARDEGDHAAAAEELEEDDIMGD